MVFNEYLVISNKISRSLSFLAMKTVITPLLEVLKFICNFWITKICQISDVCNISKFEFKTFSFKRLVVSNYTVVTVTLYWHYSCIKWKMASLKRNRLSFPEKYKTIIEVESGTKSSRIAKKYGVPRNTISICGYYLEIKKKLTVRFNLVRLISLEYIKQSKNNFSSLFSPFWKVRI